MRGLNRVMVIGNATAQAELRTTSTGTNIATVSVATNEQWKDKQTGETQERTEFHRVKFFGRLAEVAAEYITKGKQIYVEGSLRTEKYTDKNGVERYTTDIIASEMQLLGGGTDRGEGQRSARAASNGSTRPTSPRPAPSSVEFAEDDFESVPF